MNIINKITNYAYELLDRKIHRKKLFNILNKILDKPKNIIDIGAHKGSYTQMFLKLNQKANIILFEPNIYLYKKLIVIFKNKKNLKVINCGISDQQLKKKFYINKNSDYISTFSKVNYKSKYLMIRNLLLGSVKNKVTEKIVSVKKLNDFVFLKKIKIDLIKIDVEGYEEKIIKGGSLILKNTKIVLIEIHKNNLYSNYNYNKIHNKLLNLNFLLFKTVKFLFMTWEDRIYINKYYL